MLNKESVFSIIIPIACHNMGFNPTHSIMHVCVWCVHNKGNIVCKLGSSGINNDVKAVVKI